MFKPAVFTSPFISSKEGNSGDLWQKICCARAPSSYSRIFPFSIAQSLTQPPLIATTSKQPYAPKKHICKKHIPIANAYKQAGGGGGAGHSKAASKVEPSIRTLPNQRRN